MVFWKRSLILLFFLFSQGSVAQDVAAGLQGTVEQAGGVPLPGATVAAKNLATGQSHTTRSDARGRFELKLLTPGEYEVRVSGNGVASQTQTGLKLGTGQIISLSFTLEPPARSQEPSSRQAAAGSRINQEQLVGLPLNGRSYNQLATLQAGVSDPTAASGSRGIGGGSLNVVGGRNTSNSFLLDGANIMDTENQVPRSAAGVQLGSDAVLQVQVFSANYGAEYGRGSGGVLNSITRSGGNEFHGTLFEYFRSSKLDARNFFDQGPEPPPFKRNQFGATFSGPLRKEKTFFLVSFEAMRDRLNLTQIDRFPDEQARLGFPDANGVPRIAVHPQVKRYLSLYPRPNSVQLRDGVRENAAVQFLPTDENFLTARVDHSFSERDSVFLRYSFDDAASHSTGPSIVFKTRSNSRQQYLTLVESHIFSLSTVNSFRFAFTRPVTLDVSLASIEIPRSLYFFPEAPKLGDMQIAGLSGLGPPGPLPDLKIMNSFQFSDDIIVQKGSHGLKFGAQIHRYRWDDENFPERGGQWIFNSLDSFLQGGITGTNVEVAVPGSDKYRAHRQTLFGFYFQDTYNARANLQINLGLRYEFATMLHERDGKSGFLADLWRDQVVTLGPPLAGNPSLRSFAPRLGITWSPGGSSNTVLSWGFGIYYDQMLRYAMSHRDIADPIYRRRIRTNFDARPYFPDPVAATVGLPFQVRVMEYWNRTVPRVLRYNFALQRSLPGGWRAQGTYVGARGNHLYRGYETNLFPLPTIRPDGSLFFPPEVGPINPAFTSGIVITNSDAQSFYNALQLSVNKSLSRGLSLQASYTYSKSVDDSSATWSETGQYGYMRTLARGLSDFDIRHRLVLNYFYNLPVGGGQRWWKSGMLANVLGGWRLGGIVSFRRGTPFTATLNVRNPGYLFAATWPNLVAGGSNNPTSGVSAGCAAVEAGRELQAPDLYFDPCAFRVPEPGTMGNAGRNTLIAPSIFSMDLSLQREFLLDAKRRLQFRAEFFNLPNHTNFGKPSAGVFTGVFPGRFNPTVGRISETNTTSRQVQFALRFSF